MNIRTYFRRRVAITNEHGSWVFLFSPLLIGLFAGNRFSLASFFLVVASLAAFLIRHPITIYVKAWSGRRSRKDLPAARFWVVVYGLLGLSMVSGLIWQGFGYVLYLAIPGIPVFLWHLHLVYKRAERRQMGIELVASGVLALTAPAAYWVAVENPDPLGWVLWVLTWLQSAASIVYAYLRLDQRSWKELPPLAFRLRRGFRALLYTSFNLGLVVILAMMRITPPGLVLPYGLQWAESVWGSLVRPAVGVKPTQVGLRQLAVSTAFTLFFILGWRTR